SCIALLSPVSFSVFSFFCFFFFNDTAPTEIYSLSLHDALPIWSLIMFQTFISRHNSNFFSDKLVLTSVTPASSAPAYQKKSLNRSEERFSRNAETDLVCRLLLEKKKKQYNHTCDIDRSLRVLQG